MTGTNNEKDRNVDMKLPEPSGPVTYNPTVQNSYGGRGCFYVGVTEVECPTEDIQYHLQGLADSYAALEYENITSVDLTAARARGAYYGLDDPVADWKHLPAGYRDRWRAVVRLVKTDAP